MVFLKKRVKKTPEEIALEREQAEQRRAGIEDQFQAKGFEFAQWIKNNRSTVIGLALIIVVGGLAWSGYLVWKNSVNKNASAAFLQAFDDLEQNQQPSQDHVEAMRQKLAEMQKQYPNAKVTQLAHLYSGHLALEAKKADLAITEYQAFLDSAKSTNELRVLGMLGLAFAYEAKGDSKTALENFEKITTQAPQVGQDLALWQVARLAKQSGAMDKAQQAAKMLLKQFPTSAYAPNAKLLVPVK